MIHKLADVALREVGNRETGGNNRGPAVVKYQLATEMKPGPWAWCAAFVDWCVAQWLAVPENLKWLNLPDTITPQAWRPKTTAAFGFIDWARSRPHTTLILPEDTTPNVGDIMVFDMSHVGIVVPGSTVMSVETVEGNTSGKGGRESTSGDGVWSKKRAKSMARCYVRIKPFKG